MSEFYGLNAFGLSDRRFVGLWANIPRLEARRTRERLQAAGVRLTVDQVYRLTLAETESEEIAQRAASDHAYALMKAGQTPE